MNLHSSTTPWKIAYWTLLPVWMAGAAMNMWHVHGGFLTNYLADLTFPPWYYMVMRGPTTTGKKPPKLLRWFSHSGARVAISIFLAGVAYEVGERFGVVPGTFDTWDIVAYAVGPVICYALEIRKSSRGASLIVSQEE